MRNRSKQPALPSYIGIVEIHEREWGTEVYPNRPTLSQLLHNRIVCMWSDTEPQKGKPMRFFLSCYNEFAALHDDVASMIVSGKVSANPNRKLARVFVDQAEVDIVSIKIELKAKSTTP